MGSTEPSTVGGNDPCGKGDSGASRSAGTALAKESNNVLVKVTDLAKCYHNENGQRRVLSGISLEVRRGETVVLLGENGAGKTTLLHLLAGIVRIEGTDSGQITVGDDEPGDANSALVFQGYGQTLFPWLDVVGNITFRRVGRLSRKQREDHATQLLQQLGFEEIVGRLHSRVYQLSGGQQQMVAIARALFPTPDLLLLDEPFSALATNRIESCMKELRRFLQRTPRAACVVGLHSVDDAMRLGDRVLVIGDGKVKCEKQLNGGTNAGDSNQLRAEIRRQLAC